MIELCTHVAVFLVSCTVADDGLSIPFCSSDFMSAVIKWADLSEEAVLTGFKFKSVLQNCECDHAAA